jgi:hypothetical protein
VSVDKDTLRLAQKMGRAEMALEMARGSHADSCPVEDPDSMAPCNCGVGTKNAAITRALRELKIED